MQAARRSLIKPIHSIKNQFVGINPHWHSFMQGEHKWNRFHNPYIAALVIHLRQQLLPIGYTAHVEQSLQIRRLGEPPQTPQSDILIRDTWQRAALTNTPYALPEMTVEEMLQDEIEVEHPYTAG
jgi:hypothetical protein